MTPKLRGWIGAAHPFPLVMVVVLTALVALASTGGEPDGVRLLLVLGAMFFSQLSIGWCNDYLDREVDAVHQPEKPIPAGIVNPKRMPRAIGTALGFSIGLGWILGLTPLALLIAGTACGFFYNMGVKATRLSAVPFIVAFAVLPPFVWTALDVYRDEFLSLYAVGTPLALAAHIANILPDVETDAVQGRRTLVVSLGPSRSVAVLLACMTAPFIGFACAHLFFDEPFGGEAFVGIERSTLIAAMMLVYGALWLGAAALYAGRPERGRLVWGFRVVVLASVLFAGGWLASV